eukprot:CAMPEP_0183549772 /NCGR_PEP_ID=MMETSP0371-20130417/63764_1 /TAXON_ID=268820 /ORGANISM="Peridinium aciculiferum, Strain PAER-2" /LENGTH=81 /DNA_ID=CAMNT_0025753661 /DNA_START=395 /DNA_END=636 /DNA_ORIENTATION=-
MSHGFSTDKASPISTRKGWALTLLTQTSGSSTFVACSGKSTCFAGSSAASDGDCSPSFLGLLRGSSSAALPPLSRQGEGGA